MPRRSLSRPSSFQPSFFFSLFFRSCSRWRTSLLSASVSSRLDADTHVVDSSASTERVDVAPVPPTSCPHPQATRRHTATNQGARQGEQDRVLWRYVETFGCLHRLKLPRACRRSRRPLCAVAISGSAAVRRRRSHLFLSLLSAPSPPLLVLLAFVVIHRILLLQPFSASRC